MWTATVLSAPCLLYTSIPIPIQAQTAVDLLNSDDETGEDKVLPVQNGRLEIKLKGNWGAVLKVKGEN